MKTIATFAFSLATAWAVEWKPINPADLALKEPKVDKNADAEAIFWDVRVADTFRSFPMTEHVIDNYVRVKIFNDRGVKSQSTVDVPYIPAAKQFITNLKARTIKANGTIVEMKDDSVFDKTNVKVGRRVAMKTRSFTLPSVAPGDIVEYQWREVFSEYVPWYTELRLSRDVPVWKTTYLVRPLVHEMMTERMNSYHFNCQTPPWTMVKTPEPFMMTFLENVPANVDEPLSPPDDEIQPWILLYYTREETQNPRQYWNKLGKQINETYKRELKVNGDVKALAAAATEGATTPEEKARKIADFCRTQIKNVNYMANGMTAEEKSKYKPKEIQTTADTAKIKIGYGEDINKLFVAMATAAGLEAHGVRAASNRSAWFRADMFNAYLLRQRMTAVKIGDQWKFFDVGSPYLPSGMVDPDAENMTAVILDDKNPVIMQIPPSEPDNTFTQREAKLKLTDEGAIEGHVKVTLTGHRSVAIKNRFEELSEAKRKEELETTIKQQQGGEAEISNLVIENVTDPLKPLTYSYDIKAVGYAQRTGKRLFFQPVFFERGRAALFANQQRKFHVSFPYAYRELDSIELELPEGFRLENPEMPGSLKLGDAGVHDVTLSLADGGKKLVAKRELVWGKGGALVYPAESYALVKKAFDLIHQRDEHMLTLRAQ